MNNYTISIFDNKIFFEILKEVKLFSKFKIKNHTDLDSCINEASQENQIVIFFKDYLNQIKISSFPIIFISNSKKTINESSKFVIEELKIPFKISDFEKKIISVIARSQFKKNSFINLNGYIIDKNERKIKKNNMELQLSEKEVNFLILFAESNEPISRNFVLQNVWNYSQETETHTIETHIHRLRKKILDKFKDNNFIKNNKKGYYI